MQNFQDTATGRIWVFEDDVTVTDTGGVYSFATVAGVDLTAPTTLQPYAGAFPPPPTSDDLWLSYHTSALSALATADNTMLRVSDAVALGLTTWTAADVATFATYRRALRAIVQTKAGTPGTLPAKPPYPAGT